MPGLLTAVAVLTILGAAIGALLGLANRRLLANPEPLVDTIDTLLPQTQCAQCGYPGCRPYARALAAGAPINLCPPGGAALVTQLARLLNTPAAATDGFEAHWQQPRVAVIREDSCIGCALCLPACPVDAIIGAPRYLHTVLADECTGCELCLPPCPVDCIEMAPHPHAAARPA